MDFNQVMEKAISDAMDKAIAKFMFKILHRFESLEEKVITLQSDLANLSKIVPDLVRSVRHIEMKQLGGHTTIQKKAGSSAGDRSEPSPTPETSPQSIQLLERFESGVANTSQHHTDSNCEISKNLGQQILRYVRRIDTRIFGMRNALPSTYATAGPGPSGVSFVNLPAKSIEEVIVFEKMITEDEASHKHFKNQAQMICSTTVANSIRNIFKTVAVDEVWCQTHFKKGSQNGYHARVALTSDFPTMLTVVQWVVCEKNNSTINEVNSKMKHFLKNTAYRVRHSNKGAAAERPTKFRRKMDDAEQDDSLYEEITVDNFEFPVTKVESEPDIHIDEDIVEHEENDASHVTIELAGTDPLSLT